MGKIKIELDGGKLSTILEFDGMTFADKCAEIVKCPFYITMGDMKNSALIPRDKISRIINLEP